MLQYFDPASKEYTIQMLGDPKQEIKHTLQNTLWRMARRSDAGAGLAPAAAAAGGVSKGPEKEGLVGQRIEVWWTTDKTFYAGKVTVSQAACNNNLHSCALSCDCPMDVMARCRRHVLSVVKARPLHMLLGFQWCNLLT